MVIKVNEDRRSDVIARRDAWQKDYEDRMARYKAQDKEYRLAQKAVSDEVIKTITNAIGGYLPKYLQIRAQEGFTGYEITINYAQNNVHAEDKSLSWNFDITLDKDGNVKKETGSWSGLQATTPEQINDLRKTVQILEVLNDMDWKTILDKAIKDTPDYKDYITEPNPNWDRNMPDWNKELALATIEDSIGRNVLIKGTGERGGTVYYTIIKQTPKRYEVKSVPGYIINSIQDGSSNYDSIEAAVKDYNYSYGISKDKFYNLVTDYKNPGEVKTIEY